uniref:Uncharacterized protein AlNc14C90G5671 n=1 Tax=Albugo laibachii Nc14 TaxID=890382 RepID=F0WGD9_9STRA|nr:conserved hypothetical protein [Albugo laibachii Nc14]|eukprot:CCA20300.1 conserved hypothetical protein [Albugo laibachii Nc14]
MKDATLRRQESRGAEAALDKRVLNETNLLLLDIGLGKDHRRLFSNVKDLTASISSMSVAVYEKLFQICLENICRHPVTTNDYIKNADGILEALRAVHLTREAESASILDSLSGTDICSGDVGSIGKLIAVFREIYEALYLNTSLNAVLSEDQDVVDSPQKAKFPVGKQLDNSKGEQCEDLRVQPKTKNRSTHIKWGGKLASARIFPERCIKNRANDTKTGIRHDNALRRSHISPIPSSTSTSGLSYKKFRERQAVVSFGSVSPVEINQSPHNLVRESRSEMELNGDTFSEVSIADDQNVSAKLESIDPSIDLISEEDQDKALREFSMSSTFAAQREKGSRSSLYPLMPMRLSARTRRAEKKYSLLIQDHVETLRLQEKRHRELLARRFRVNKHQQQIDAIRHRNFQQTLCQERLAAQMQQKTTLESHMRIMMSNVLVIEKDKLKVKQKEFNEQIKSIQSNHQRQERALETFFDHQLALLKEELLRNTIEQSVAEKAHRLASKQLLRDLRHEQDDTLKLTIDKAQERQKQRLFAWEREHQRQITQLNQKEPKRNIDPFHAAAIKARELRHAKKQSHRRPSSRHKKST